MAVAVWALVMTGAGAVTERVKLEFAERVPSLTVRVMVAEPDWPEAGMMVTVRLAPLPPSAIFALGTSVVLEEAPLTERLPAAVCASPTVKLSGPTVVPALVV